MITKMSCHSPESPSSRRLFFSDIVLEDDDKVMESVPSDPYCDGNRSPTERAALIHKHCQRSVDEMDYKEVYDYLNAVLSIINASMFVSHHKEEFMNLLAERSDHIHTLRHLFKDQNNFFLLFSALQYYRDVKHEEQVRGPNARLFLENLLKWDEEVESEIEAQQAILDELAEPPNAPKDSGWLGFGFW